MGLDAALWKRFSALWSFEVQRLTVTCTRPLKRENLPVKPALFVRRNPVAWKFLEVQGEVGMGIWMFWSREVEFVDKWYGSSCTYVHALYIYIIYIHWYVSYLYNYIDWYLFMYIYTYICLFVGIYWGSLDSNSFAVARLVVWSPALSQWLDLRAASQKGNPKQRFQGWWKLPGGVWGVYPRVHLGACGACANITTSKCAPYFRWLMNNSIRLEHWSDMTRYNKFFSSAGPLGWRWRQKPFITNGTPQHHGSSNFLPSALGWGWKISKRHLRLSAVDEGHWNKAVSDLFLGLQTYWCWLSKLYFPN